MDNSADCQDSEAPRLQQDGERPPLSRTDPRPLHVQIADELRRQIGVGKLRPGDLLPSENELMTRYGVARGTVRQALAALRADGSIAEIGRAHV